MGAQDSIVLADLEEERDSVNLVAVGKQPLYLLHILLFSENGNVKLSQLFCFVFFVFLLLYFLAVQNSSMGDLVTH